MINWGDWLGRKYAIMQQEADANRTRADAGLIEARAGANLSNVRAGLLPGESASNIGLNAAQAAAQRASAAQTEEETKFVAPLARASIFNTRQQGSLYGSEAAGNNILNRSFQRFRFGGLFGDDDVSSLRRGLKAGLGPFGE